MLKSHWCEYCHGFEGGPCDDGEEPSDEAPNYQTLEEYNAEQAAIDPEFIPF